MSRLHTAQGSGGGAGGGWDKESGGEVTLGGVRRNLLRILLSNNHCHSSSSMSLRGFFAQAPSQNEKYSLEENKWYLDQKELFSYKWKMPNTFRNHAHAHLGIFT